MQMQRTRVELERPRVELELTKEKNKTKQNKTNCPTYPSNSLCHTMGSCTASPGASRLPVSLLFSLLYPSLPLSLSLLETHLLHASRFPIYRLLTFLRSPALLVPTVLVAILGRNVIHPLGISTPPSPIFHFHFTLSRLDEPCRSLHGLT